MERAWKLSLPFSQEKKNWNSSTLRFIRELGQRQTVFSQTTEADGKTQKFPVYQEQKPAAGASIGRTTFNQNWWVVKWLGVN